MRDKQAPGDTYNYKEHVYADPVALRKEMELDKKQAAEAESKQENTGKPKSFKPRVVDPPPVPSGPRQSVQGNSLYAELQKKSNVPPPPCPPATQDQEEKPKPGSVHSVGSLFGGTIKRTSPREDSEVGPPLLPAVTESRNILDEPDSPPGSPTIDHLLTNIPVSSTSTELPSEEVSSPVENDKEVNFSPEESNEALISSEDAELQEQNSSLEGIGLEEVSAAPSPEPDENEVVIDVKINSSAGIEIGAEIPVASSNTAEDSAQIDDGAVRLIKNTKLRDSVARESEKTRDSVKPTGSTRADAASKAAVEARDGSEVGSGSSATSGDSTKRRKKKDLESGHNSVGHLRRNLIIISLFLLILLILISAVIVGLLTYTGQQN